MLTDERVRRLLALILNVDIPAGQDFHRDGEPKWDSLKHIEIIFALEDEFGIQFNEECLVSLVSVRAIVAAVESCHAA